MEMNIQGGRIKIKMALCFILLTINSIVIAQMGNHGATITVDSGSSIVCMGDFNNAAGTITNEGRLDIKGSFSNSAVYNSVGKNDSLFLTGIGAVKLGIGSDTVSNLIVNKVDSGGVILSANALVGKTFQLLSGGFTTDLQNSYELVAPISANFKFGDSTFVIGKVRRTQWTNGAAVVFNHPNMVVRTTNGQSPSTILVNLEPSADLPVPATEVKYNYYFTPFSGRNYAAEVTFPYSFAQFNETNEAGLLPAYSASNTWNTKFIGNVLDTAADYIRSIGIVSNLFENSKWKLSVPSTRPTTTASNVYVYPIPARNNLNVLLTADKNYKARISLLDVSGKLCRIMQQDVVVGLNYLNINVAGLSTGKYILKLERPGAIQTKVILISH